MENLLLTTSATIDTEQGNDSNSGNVDFGGAVTSANAVGLDLTIDATTGEVLGAIAAFDAEVPFTRPMISPNGQFVAGTGVDDHGQRWLDPERQSSADMVA